MPHLAPPRPALITRLGLPVLAAVLLALGGGLSARGAGDAAGPGIPAGKVDTPPVPLTQAKPTYPMALRAKRIEGKILVDFIVLPDGSVKSAHAPENAEPEFAAAAVAAVSQWTFKPATKNGQPVAVHLRVPIIFALSGTEPVPISLAIGPLEMTGNLRTGERGLIIHVNPTGPSAVLVHAGRFILAKAQDDTGAELKQDGTPAFHHASVGGASSSTTREPIAFTLMGLAKDAKALPLVEGKLELYVPAQDPAATATIGDVPAKFGVPLEDPALKKADVTLVVYDQPTAVKMATAKAPAGPQEYDGGPFFGSDNVDPSLPPAAAQAIKVSRQSITTSTAKPGTEFAERMRKMNVMGEHDIAVGWRDPAHRIVGMEFQAADGSPLTYDHKGHYHSELGYQPNGLDAYDLRGPLPAGAKLVCWVLTENSILTVPMKLVAVPLSAPRPPASPAKAPAASH